MVENFEDIEGKTAVVTRETKRDKASKISAASWYFTGSGISAFEYSTDPLVQTAGTYLSANPEVIRALREVVESYEMSGAIAAAVVDREQFSPFRAKFKEGYEWVERTDSLEGGKHQNVLLLRKLSESDKLRHIETQWGFSEVPGMACPSRCPINPLEDRHEGIRIHLRG